MKDSWDAIVFHSSIENNRSGCKVSIERGNTLIGELPNGEKLELNLRETTLTLGGTGNNLLFIKSIKGEKEATFSVRDRSIIEALKATGLPDIQFEIDGFRKQVWFQRSWFVGSVITVFLLILATFGIFTFFGVPIIVSAIPESVDIKIGNITSKSISEKHVYKNKVVNKAMNKIFKRLTTHLPQHKFQFKLTIIKSSQINAFAVSGGHIYMYTGLIKLSNSPEEVAGVLAHEIGHVMKRHTLKHITQQMGTWMMLQAYFGNMSGLVDSLIQEAHNLGKLSYSRSMEKESDLFAFNLMVKASLSPKYYQDFFEKLAQKNRIEPIEIFSTHPHTSSRIEDIKKMSQRIKNITFKSLDLNWEKVKNTLK